ncbi:hypothetical protein F2P56_033328, partial [Juglans regia]
MAPARRNVHPEGSSEPPPNEPEVLAAAATRLLRYFVDEEDEADEWWTSTRELLLLELNDGVSITWDRFKRAFLDRYFSPALREAKARQFLDLVQGTMTVERYTATFVALSRFASYLVPDEEKKCEKFERGLQPRIRSRLIPLRIRNFTDLVTRATLIEEDMRANAELFNQRKRHQPLPEPNRNKKPTPS